MLLSCLEGHSDVTTPLYNCTDNFVVAVERSAYRVNVKIHLMFRLRIQSANLQEVECGFYLLSET